MNYNAQNDARQPGIGRKVKRVSDVNAIGGTVPSAQFVPTQGGYGAPPSPQPPPSHQAQSPYMAPPPNSAAYAPYSPQQQPQQQQYASPQPGPSGIGGGAGGFQPGPYNSPQGSMQQTPGGFSMFQQPLVQDMALQYGARLADQGRELVNKEFEKYIPVSKLKYYFAVDNKYVMRKLRLLFFPFAHKEWSVKYEENSQPIQPRYDVNAPDLYIPTMSYITFVVLAGLVLGIQDRFTPEQLGIQASSALAYSIIELLVYVVTLYVTNIPTTLRTFDLLALSGYKYAIICAILLWSILLGKIGYYSSLAINSLTFGFFLLRTLRAKINSGPIPTPAAPPPYGVPYGQQETDHSVARKRKLYFLFMFAGLQPVLAFWLTMHLRPIGARVE